MLVATILLYCVMTFLFIIWLDNAGTVKSRIIWNISMHALIWLTIWMLWVPKY